MSDRVGAVFSALADDTRRGLFSSIAERGPLTATELAADVPISRQAVAKHLGVLRSAGLVTSERAGRETRYAASPAPLEETRAWMDRVGNEWDRRLAALRNQLESR